MRKVIYGINLTADGCCEHTKVKGSEEVHEFFTNLMHDVDLIVYGRKTYELMVPYWPEVAKQGSGSAVDIEFAQRFVSLDKIVFSRTLTRAAENTRIIRDDLAGEILKLKQQSGKNISIGGVDLPSQLIALGLVDEFYIVVHPIIAGAGRRLMADTSLANGIDLVPLEATMLKDGCVAMHYRKA